jgi:hypothetical protein
MPRRSIDTSAGSRTAGLPAIVGDPVDALDVEQRRVRVERDRPVFDRVQGRRDAAHGQAR